MPYVYLFLQEPSFKLDFFPELSDSLRILAIVGLSLVGGGFASFFYYGLFHLEGSGVRSCFLSIEDTEDC